MKILLIILVGFMTLSSVFNWDPGAGPGLNIKNLFLYLAALGIVLRATFTSFKIEMPSLFATFIVLSIYAIASYVVVISLVDYPYYDVRQNALMLKGQIEWMLFFAVFLYGARTDEDSISLLKWLAAAWLLSHVMAVLDALSIVSFGNIETRRDGRVQGLVGESNQYGAFVALSLPALASLVFLTRGFWRMFWAGATLITALTLLMTVSRGAFVGIIVAAALGVHLFRRYAPRGRLLSWTAFSMLFGVVVLTAVIALGYGPLLYERVIEGIHSGDMEATSSSRTHIWSTLLAKMYEQPLTFLTGYGWRSYWALPFRYSPHNYYLNLWFNLGLVGLACSVILFVIPVRRAIASIAAASIQARAVLIGFVISAVAYAVSTFFVDLYVPWAYFWAYAGIAMRVALNAQTVPATVPELAATARRKETVRTDPYGWAARAR